MAKYKLLRFDLNSDGVRELLQGAPMQAIIKEKAAAKARAAGKGYGSAVHVGQRRAYANIYPKTTEANKDNLKNNTLEKVIRR